MWGIRLLCLRHNGHACEKKTDGSEERGDEWVRVGVSDGRDGLGG